MAVVILGMHRGGTSAVTGALHHLGLAVGPEAALMEATEANETGHWELNPLSELDEALLLDLGGRWSGPPVAPVAEQEAHAAAGWGERAGDLVAELLPGDDWVWKDPRACLLLPFWRSVLAARGVTPVVVAVLRHPDDVARSLERRDGLPRWYGEALWERHMRRAVHDSAGLPVHVVAYDDLVDRPADVLPDVAAFLRSHGQAVDVERLPDAVAFLDPGIRHHRRTEDGDTAPSTPATQALYQLLRGRLGDQTDRWGEGVDPERPELQRWFDEHHRLLGFRDLSEQLRAGLEEVSARKDAEREELQRRKDAEADALRASVERLERWWAESRDDATRAWSEVRRLEAELADAELARAALVEALEAAIEERNGWKWTVLQHEQRASARARRAVRRALVGDEE